MTNQTVPRSIESIDPTIRALAPVGGSRRPVKIVQHPAFRQQPAHAARQAALQASFIALPVRVVSLNGPTSQAGCHASAA